MPDSRYSVNALVPSGTPAAAEPSMGGNGRASRAEAAEPDAKLDLLKVARALWRRRGLVVLITLGSIGAMAAYSTLVDPVYQAGSIVAIDTRQKAAGGMAAGVIAFGETRALTSEVGVLQNSVELAERVVHRLQQTAEATAIPGFFPILVDESGAAHPAHVAAAALLRRMRFQPLPAEEMINLSVESTVPAEAASIANFYAEEYQKLSRENSRASLAAARAFMEDQVAKRGEELALLEEQWVAFAQQNQTAVRGLEGERVAAAYASLSASLDTTRLSAERVSFSLGLLQQQIAQAEPDLPEKVQQDHSASALESQIALFDEYIAELQIQAEEFYSLRPSLRGNEDQDEDLATIVSRIQSLRARKAELTDRLVSESIGAPARSAEGGHLGYVMRLKQVAAQKETRLRELAAHTEALNARLQTYGSQLDRVPRQAIERERIERRRAQIEQWYGASVAQLQQTLVAEEAELGYVSVIRGAVVPTVPVRPNTRQNLLLGLLLGLGLGVGLALVRESIDLRYTAPEDLESEPYPLLGVVPRYDKKSLAALAAARIGGGDGAPSAHAGAGVQLPLISLLSPWSPITEHYRLIRTRIEHAAERVPMQVLLVTSPTLGDGKSVTTANLAVVMAQSHRRTLVVDADMRRPAGHTLFGPSSAPGLGELLAGRHEFQPEVYESGLEGLSFLPAGEVSAPPSELLGGPAARALLETLRGHYDVIFVDSPPVLAVPDAVTLAPLCDAVLTVVAAGRNDRPQLAQTQGALAAVGTHVTGVILTHFDAGKSGSSYRYPSYGYTLHE